MRNAWLTQFHLDDSTHNSDTTIAPPTPSVHHSSSDHQSTVGTSSNFSSIDSEDNQGLTEEQATFRRLLIRNHRESLMLLKIQSKEDKEQFLLPHYTAESALHEQFLANAKTPNGYTNIKNALLISLAALNELCKQDNTFVSSPISTTDTTTPMANPKIPYKSLTDPPNDIQNTGMKIGMNKVE